MQPYEPSRAPRPYRGPGPGIPAMRTGHDSRANSASATPIYDALYAEYSRLFRTLPGDRTGEEELRFEGFGTVHGTGSWGNEGWQHDSLPRRSTRVPAALPPGPRDGQAY
ncbi:hypothetical protein G4Z16_27755 [Streptomyces bathyalis]|uniref:Uncharacterized protein n=2 Tax=Streptomyces bathyalis TaxID=2710756 RepID=A0A7T1WUF7_9ACTN|nr:hypothetical protein G4Z16_27755 [Streptomyces bathyalis]